MRGSAMEANRTLLQRLIFNARLLSLDDEQEPYTVPGTPPAAITYTPVR